MDRNPLALTHPVGANSTQGNAETQSGISILSHGAEIHPACVSAAMTLLWKGGESFKLTCREPSFPIVSSFYSDLHSYFSSSHNQILPKEIVYQPNQLSHLGFSRHERTCEQESQPCFFLVPLLKPLNFISGV